VTRSQATFLSDATK